MTLRNPYRRVDWDTVGHRVAEFHVHPNYNKGLGEPAEIIDAYHQYGYEVLAISPRPGWADVDGAPLVPFPWTDLAPTEVEPSSVNHSVDWTENRDPVELGMVAIRGFEDSHVAPTHLSWFFSNYNGIEHELTADQFEQARLVLEEDSEAMVVPAHPGRYVESDVRGDWAAGEWERMGYDRFYRSLPRVVGLEVFNGAMNPDDRRLWDDLLTQFAPQRTVLGFGVDDASHVDRHEDNRVDAGRTVLLMDDEAFVPGHETGDVREVIERGQSYFSGVANNEDPHPTIEAVVHDPDAGRLTVRTSPVDHEKWIADGRVIERGPTLAYETREEEIRGYVRFEGVVGPDALPGEDGHPPEAVVCTQPFLMTGSILRAEG